MFVNPIFDANVDQLIQGPLKIWTEHSIFPMTWCGLDFYYDHWRLYPGWLQKTRKVIFNSNNHIVGEKRSIVMQFSWWINNLKIIMSFSKPCHVRCSKMYLASVLSVSQNVLVLSDKKLMKYITISMKYHKTKTCFGR